jgi:hypothetical protein
VEALVVMAAMAAVTVEGGMVAAREGGSLVVARGTVKVAAAAVQSVAVASGDGTEVGAVETTVVQVEKVALVAPAEMAAAAAVVDKMEVDSATVMAAEEEVPSTLGSLCTSPFCTMSPSQGRCGYRKSRTVQVA